MMQMLAAGGVPILSDGERRADIDNPYGYFEWERIKQLPQEPALITEAEGKAVKVISQLLLSLPDGHEYRIIFMQRPLPEVLASQAEMLRHRGTGNPAAADAVMVKAFQNHLYEVNTSLTRRSDVKVQHVSYHRVLNETKTVAEEIAWFLGIPLDTDAMTRQADSSLYRQRMTVDR